MADPTDRRWQWRGRGLRRVAPAHVASRPKNRTGPAWHVRPSARNVRANPAIRQPGIVGVGAEEYVREAGRRDRVPRRGPGWVYLIPAPGTSGGRRAHESRAYAPVNQWHSPFSLTCLFIKVIVGLVLTDLPSYVLFFTAYHRGGSWSSKSSNQKSWYNPRAFHQPHPSPSLSQHRRCTRGHEQPRSGHK